MSPEFNGHNNHNELDEHDELDLIKYFIVALISLMNHKIFFAPIEMPGIRRNIKEYSEETCKA